MDTILAAESLWPITVNMWIPLENRYPRRRIHRRRKVGQKWVYLLILFYSVRLVTIGLLFQVVQVRTTSMEPAVKTGERILIFPWLAGGSWFSSRSFRGIRPMQSGDIVLVTPENLTTSFSTLREIFSFLTFGLISSSRGIPFVRRIVGIPGDQIHIQQNEVMLIRDGTRIYESDYAPYEVQKDIHPDWQTSYPFSYQQSVQMEEDQWYLLADNRDSSFDSRTWGALPRARLSGVALYCIWPISAIRRLQ